VAKPDEPQRVDYFRQWVFHDPAWNWWRFDWDHDVDRARRTMGPVVDAVDPDLAAFKGRGGKLILFSGWQDPVVSPYDVINYYDAVVDRQDGLKNAQTFARLFMVPGMMHCAGGQGATNFASSERDSFPLRPDPAHDLTLALEQWVEQGRAPDQVIAAKYANRRGQGAPPPPDHASMFPTIDADPGKRTVVMTRPLCKYPERAIFDRRGDPNLASSYVCKIGPL
jgi:feruloyl esterase